MLNFIIKFACVLFLVMFIEVPKFYKFHRYISSGYHGDIYLVYDASYKILKKYNDITVGKGDTKIIQNLNHINIIKNIKSYKYQNCWYVEMPFYKKGNLYSRLLRTSITKNEYSKWLIQIKSAINYIHGLNISHNDLKLNNILLDNENNIIIIDFGCAKESTNDFSSDLESVKNIQQKLKSKLVLSKL